jgi:ferredoxin
MTLNEDIESRALTDKLINDCYDKGVDHVVVQSVETLKSKGFDLSELYAGTKMLPGVESVITHDLMGLGSMIASPRGGSVEDFYCNRFAAVAAGLGTLATSGRVVTREFGMRQRFIAIITDAELDADELIADAPSLCADCGDACVKACPSAALSNKKIEIECEGTRFSFNKREVNRCEWSKRYAIAGDAGFKYLGSPLDEIPEGEITAESLKNALKKHDPIKKYRPVVCEPCMLECPYSQEPSA